MCFFESVPLMDNTATNHTRSGKGRLPSRRPNPGAFAPMKKYFPQNFEERIPPLRSLRLKFNFQKIRSARLPVVSIRCDRRSEAPFILMLKSRGTIFLTGFLLFTLSHAAFGQTLWTDQTGDWLDATNWSAGVPNSSIDAEINNGGTAQIAAAASAANLRLGSNAGDSGNMSVSGSGAFQSLGSLEVGRSMVTASNGGTLTDMTGSIGASQDGGGDGVVLVDGQGSMWTNSDMLAVGGIGGSGKLMILHGGAAFSRSGRIARSTHFGGGSGSVIVDGPGSIWNNSESLTVDGTLSMQNGGSVLSDSGMVDGMALIDGAGSSWTTGRFGAGDSNFGWLTIRNGGVLTSNDISHIGNFPYGAVVLVDGVGSIWNTDFEHVQLNVGYRSTLNISHGGVVSSFGAAVGVDAFESSDVTVDGVGSAWNVRTNLYVAGGGGGESGGAGLVKIINGGKISAGTTTVFGRGTIVDNGVLMSPTVSIKAEGSFGGDGNVSGSVSSAGQLKPGDPIGSLSLAGNYTQLATGKLIMEIAGVSTDARDHLEITGNAALDGNLEVRFVNGFVPVRGQVFPLFHVAGAVAGSFAQIIFPDLRPGFQFRTEFVAGTFQITALNDGVAAAGLLNISTRGRVGTGDDALIGGFILTGSAPKKVIIRALGPSLAVGGTPVPGRLADPTLELRGGNGELISSNDNWMDSPQREEIIASTVPPDDDHEAAIVATLPPGSYTAIMRGVSGTSGIGIVELYDLAPNVSASLSNISTRGFVGTDDDVMIGGFIVDSQTSDVLLRALGPSLTQSGIGNVLANPTLELHNGNGEVIAFNNDWRDTDRTAIENTGIPPASNTESAIIATLPPGNYTTIMRGQNETSGVGLVEIYNLR